MLTMLIIQLNHIFNLKESHINPLGGTSEIYCGIQDESVSHIV